MEPRAPLNSILELTTLNSPVEAGFAPPHTTSESPLLPYNCAPVDDPKDLLVQALSKSLMPNPGQLSSLPPDCICTPPNAPCPFMDTLVYMTLLTNGD